MRTTTLILRPSVAPGTCASILCILFLLLLPTEARPQINIHTEDLPRFYQAFDSVATTSDTVKQLAFIQKLYVDKASSGLNEFMELRGGNTSKWRKYMEENKASLLEKRPYILSVLDQEAEIFRKISLYKSYYPDFRDGDIYFCVGIGNSGGTIRNKTVYIGTEVAASSMPNWSVYLVMHEFTHTQQWTQRNVEKINANKQLSAEYEKTHKNLLGKCLEEGMADFVAELLSGKDLAVIHPDGYIAFGQKHELRIWEEFKKDMSQPINWDKGWLYNSRKTDGEAMRDLGYFVGYKICKSYYEKAKNKKQALDYMIGLNLTDENSKNFLASSGYSPTINKKIKTE